MIISKGEEFIIDVCNSNPKCKNFCENIQWMIKFAYILDQKNINENYYIYTCVNMIEGLKKTRIKKGFLQNHDIAIIACSIYSFIKEGNLITDFEKQFSQLIDDIQGDERFINIDDHTNDIESNDLESNDLELILMSDD